MTNRLIIPGKIVNQAKSELKQLPYMLGKLLGSIVAIVGFTMAVLTITKNPDYLFKDLLFSLSIGGGGIFIFLVSSNLLNKRLTENKAQNLIPDDSMRTSMFSWGLLLLLVAIILLCTYRMTR
jgi:uncharacterized membrane protein